MGDCQLALDRSWDMVDILRLDESLEVILENFRKVILQFRTTEIFEDFLPIWRILAANSQLRVGWTECERLTSYLPRFGLSFPARILSAVLFPIPFVPTNPSTCPGRGVGSRWSLNALAV